jgi:hypothetical protein
VLLEIPVLTDAIGKEFTMPDSLDMTLFIALNYPDLAPISHKWQIKQFLTDLHELNYFSLSFSARPVVGLATLKKVEDRLMNTNISDVYRKLLESKRTL